MGQSRQNTESANNHAYDRLVAKLPADVLSTLTPDQLLAIANAVRAPTPNHRVDFRVSIPWFGKRAYIALFAGPENRSIERLRREGQMSLGRVAGTYGALITAVAILMMVSGSMLAYSIGKIFEDSLTTAAHARSWR